ncbi:MAG: zinc ribbon domain-containing protein [Methanobacteriota archaeon]|nr:MAG: zinc ribbon domain-containing protein [Euryarchaeota archaeon]
MRVLTSNAQEGEVPLTYCQKCGHQSPDEATFCSKCGGPLHAPHTVSGKDWHKDWDRDWNKQCENECAGGPKGASIFWGIIVILIGFAIALWALNESDVDLPQWLEDLNIGLLIGLVIAAALVITGISIIAKKAKS